MGRESKTKFTAYIFAWDIKHTLHVEIVTDAKFDRNQMGYPFT